MKSGVKNNWIALVNTNGELLFHQSSVFNSDSVDSKPFSLLSILYQSIIKEKFQLSKFLSRKDEFLSLSEYKEGDKMVLLFVFGMKNKILYDLHHSKCVRWFLFELIEMVLGKNKLKYEYLHSDDTKPLFVSQMKKVKEVVGKVLHKNFLGLNIGLHQKSAFYFKTKLKSKLLKLLNVECKKHEIADAAVFLKKRLFVCTNEWKEKEKILSLETYFSLLTSCTARDIPLYLGIERGRLVSVKLNKIVDVIFWCGAEPSVNELISSLKRDKNKWKVINGISEVSRKEINVDNNLMCFLFVKREGKEKYFVFHSFEKGEILDTEDLMGKFYVNVATEIFQSHKYLHEELKEKIILRANECFMTINEFNFYAIRDKTNELYCMYNVKVPQFALRNVTKETLQLMCKLYK